MTIKKTILSCLAAALTLLGIPEASIAQQTALVRTTLTAALGGTATDTILVLTSNTGMTATNATSTYFLLIDRELMQLQSVSGSTGATVLRGRGGANITQHVNGAPVYWGQGGQWDAKTGNSFGLFIGATATPPTGTCVRGQQQYLPLMAPSTGTIYNCLGGQWYAQNPESSVLGPVRPCTLPGLGAGALSAIGASTIPGTAGNFYIGSFYNQDTMLITSLYPLWGTVIGSATGFQTGILDATGNLLFNTTTAGLASGTVSTFQGLALGTSGLLTGPNRYFFYIQNLGVTDAIRTVASSAETLGGLSAGTFGTLGSLTSASIPTTLTAASTAPIVCAGP